MYGIFTNIYPKNHPNVGKYTIHGASGNYCTFLPPAFRSCNAACDAGPLVVSRKLAGRNRKSSSQAHEVSLDSAGKLPIPSKHWKKRNINQYNNKPPMTGNGEHKFIPPIKIVMTGGWFMIVLPTLLICGISFA